MNSCYYHLTRPISGYYQNITRWTILRHCCCLFLTALLIFSHPGMWLPLTTDWVHVLTITRILPEDYQSTTKTLPEWYLVNNMRHCCLLIIALVIFGRPQFRHMVVITQSIKWPSEGGGFKVLDSKTINQWNLEEYKMEQEFPGWDCHPTELNDHQKRAIPKQSNWKINRKPVIHSHFCTTLRTFSNSFLKNLTAKLDWLVISFPDELQHVWSEVQKGFRIL